MAQEQRVSVAAEFGTSAITGPSIGDSLPQLPPGNLLDAAGEKVLFCDQRAKGSMLSTRTPERATADCQAVSTITGKPYQVNSIACFVVDASTRSLRRERRGYGGGGDVQPVGLSWR